MRLRLRDIIITLVLILPVLFYSYRFWNQNKTVPKPADAIISQSLEFGINWLVRNEDRILSDNNPMLWWMLQQTAKQTHDSRLNKLFQKYNTRYLSNNRRNIWLPLFKENSWVPVRYEQISHFPYYNKHFIYSLSCDQDLAKVEEIAKQDEADFCGSHPLRPACVTHQLMGIRMQQRKKCADEKTLYNTVNALQSRIVTQLTWDPRVVDVYLQRVLMLLESGAGEQIKPVWLQQVIDAQSKEGGWDSFDPFFPLPASYDLGFTARGVWVQKPRNSFHATIQGVYIMSLLLHGE